MSMQSFSETTRNGSPASVHAYLACRHCIQTLPSEIWASWLNLTQTYDFFTEPHCHYGVSPCTATRGRGVKSVKKLYLGVELFVFAETWSGCSTKKCFKTAKYGQNKWRRLGDTGIVSFWGLLPPGEVPQVHFPKNMQNFLFRQYFFEIFFY